MTYYSRDDLAHEFFYNDNARNYPSYSACGYDGDNFYSYQTLIATLKTDKDGALVCLLSIENMSNTTAKHINAVRSAAPCKVIRVYMEYGERDSDVNTFARRAVKNMEYYSRQKLTQAANRNGFLTAFNSFNALADAFKLSVKLPAKYKKLAAIINNSASVKELKARAAKRAKLDAENARRKLNKLLKTNNICELARLAYDSDELTSEQRADIRKALNPRGELAFVWYDKQRAEFVTSKHIHMTIREGLAALKLWAAGRLRHGLKVGYYTVLEVMESYVQIGCHKIPTENLKTLAALILEG